MTKTIAKGKVCKWCRRIVEAPCRTVEESAICEEPEIKAHKTIVERGDNSPEIEAKVDRIVARAGDDIDKLGTRIGEVMHDQATTRKVKYFKLVELAEKATPHILPDTPCRKGCAACCHIACAITEREAFYIGRATGRTPMQLPRSVEDSKRRVDENVYRFYGKPCTFLGEDKSCTIYEHRPMACRIQHSLNDTAAECEPVPGQADKPMVPQINLTNLIAAAVFLDLDGAAFGDIREFFP